MTEVEVDIKALKAFVQQLTTLKGQVDAAKAIGPAGIAVTQGADPTAVMGEFEDAHGLYNRWTAAHDNLSDVDTLSKAIQVLIDGATAASKNYADAQNIDAVTASQIKALLGEAPK
jgi:hypothetical protein